MRCFRGSVLGSTVILAAAAATPLTSPELPSMAASMVRLLGALVLVIALFFGGVWLSRNWRRWTPRSGPAPELRILEVRSVGVRQSLVVVAYRRQRMLLASGPAGVALVTHLPEAAVDEPASETRPDFAEAFQRVLAGRA